jgi:hypothetical protein
VSAPSPKIPIVEHVAGSVPALVVASLGGYACLWVARRSAIGPPSEWVLPSIRAGCIDALILAFLVWRVQRGARTWAIVALASSGAGVSLVGSLIVWNLGSSLDPFDWQLPSEDKIAFAVEMYFKDDPGVVLDIIGLAVGFALAARWRGRWFEGVGLAVPQAAFGTLHALAWPNAIDPMAQVFGCGGYLLGACPALPLARHAARAAFEKIGLHVREAPAA